MSTDGTMKAIISADNSEFKKVIQDTENTASSASAGLNKSFSGAGAGMETATQKSGFLNSSIGKIAAGVGAVQLVTKGIDVLKSSVGSAVGRFDTLNAYPKVMAQMGYSTQDVTKSVSVLKKGVDGLPTSLQDLTKSAQSFAILTGSATKGAQAASAMNDAFIASGASAATAEQGTQDYSKMLAEGKVNMQDWNSVAGDMPLAMKQVANSFGLTGKSAVKELYNKLKAGDITMEQLNDRFIQLDGGAKGFAATARAASGGIGTSFTNMKNAVVNGLANTIQTINDSLKSAGLKNGIATIFDQGKQAIVKGFAVINKIVKTVIPPAVNMIKELSPVIKAVAPALAVLGGGFAAGTASIIGFTKATSGVAKAFDLVYKHPIVTAIVLLAVAFSYAYQNIKPFHDFIDKVVKKLNELASSIPKTIGGLDTMKTIIGVLSGSAGLGILIAGFLKFKKGLDAVKSVTENVTKPMAEVEGAVTKAGSSSFSASSKIGALATNILKIGVGIGAATAGIGLMAFGLASLAKTGTAGIVAIVAVSAAIAILAGIFALLGPSLTAGAVGIGVFGAAILAIGVGIGAASAGIALLINTLNNVNLSATQVTNTMTAIGQGFSALITSFITSLAANAPIIVSSFMQMILSFVTTLAVYVPQITVQFAQMIIGFLTTLANYLPQIISSGTTLIVNFLNGIAAAIPRVIPAAINVITTFINSIADNLQSIINAGVNLIGKFIVGLVNAIPKIVDYAVQAVDKFVYGVGYAIGKALSSGGKLIASFVKGIWNGLTDSKNAGESNGNAVSEGIGHVDLGAAGRAIMNGFLGGLKDAWGNVQSFVSGIGSWIEKNKGPISYDKKLLIPAGQAIMGGFGSSLNDAFGAVKNDVLTYADQLSGAMNNVSFSGAIQKVSDFQSRLQNNALTAQTSIAGGNSSYSSEMSQDVLSAPSANITVEVHQEWDGDNVYSYVKNKDARVNAKIKMFKK